MSDLISLPALREHVRVGSEVSDDTLRGLLVTAEDVVAGFLGRPCLVDPVLAWSAGCVPSGVLHAVKVVVTDLYENRVTPLGDGSPLYPLCGRHMRLSIG